MTKKEYQALDAMEKAQCRIDWAIAACCIVPAAAFIIATLFTI